MGYDKLERNLIDIIKEEQAKLGFFKEDIRLYYPLSSLNHFFSATDNADEMQARLNALPTSITEKLVPVHIQTFSEGLDRSKSLTKEIVSVFTSQKKEPSMCMITPHQTNSSKVLWN